jgi:ATP/maltotriose-dependent transcriptional regulator MalT
MIGTTLHWLGQAELRAGDTRQAQRTFEQSLEQREAADDFTNLAEGLHDLACVAVAAGNCRHAADLCQRCLALLEQQTFAIQLPRCVQTVSKLAMTTGRAAEATRLLASAVAMREALHVPFMQSERPEVDAACEALRRTLGQAEYTAAWETGRRWSPAEANAHAMKEAARAGSADSESRE